jgi:thiamine kinase-like enzyme
MFRARAVVNHLTAAGLISPAALVSGDVTVTEVPRRNHNVKVVVRGAPSYFVKQAIDSSSRSSIAHEAEFYRFVSSSPVCGRLRTYLPQFFGYDEGAHLLILELHETSRDLAEHNGLSHRLSTRLARQTASALAELHKLTDFEKSISNPTFKSDTPWVLSVHEPSLEMLGRISAGNLKLVRAIQYYSGFTDSLTRLSLEWNEARLVHFDIKSDNILVVRSPNGRWTRLTIVDWELVGLGDACWDIGSVFADYLVHWLLTIPQVEGQSPEAQPQLGTLQLVRIQGALQAFWKEYAEQMSLGNEADTWLIRSVKYAAARLLQRCYEHLQLSVDLPTASVRCLQVSQNMLLKPAEAAVRLLGLPCRWGTLE